MDPRLRGDDDKVQHSTIWVPASKSVIPTPAENRRLAYPNTAVTSV